MRKSIVGLLLLGTAGLGSSRPNVGGWSVVTVDDLPDYVTAGQPFPLSFVVRQHGMTRLDGLKPTVEAKLGRENVSLSRPRSLGAQSGRYVATLILPRAGDWTLTIEGGFGMQPATQIPLRAVDAGTSPRRLSDVERGRRLFIAKGCFTCHVNTEVTTAPSLNVGPQLTGRRYPPINLAKFLANPDSNPLTQSPRMDWVRMPTLGLKEHEIVSLVTMINTGGRELSAR